MSHDGQRSMVKVSCSRVQNQTETQLLTNRSIPPKQSQVDIKITNTAKVPAFMVKLDITGIKRAFFANNNYFWLSPGESKTITLEILWREPFENKKLTRDTRVWNSNLETIV